jgi:ABC-type amino acid transport substrate-binding protein
MAKYGKLFALVAIVALAVSALALAGCTTTPATPAETTSTPVATQIKSTNDLKSGDKIAVQSGTTGELWANDNLKPKGVVVVPFDDVLAAFAALQAGDVKGVINDLPISQDIAKDPARGVEVVQEIKTDEGYGFAFNKSNTVLRDAVNWGLAQVIADGQYAKIYETWFGAPPMTIPPAPTTAKPTAAIKTITKGKIIVGSDTSFPPFENVVDGKTVGFDVDLVAAIAAKLGLTSQFKTYKFDALVTGMQAGTEFDMIASGMTSTGSLGDQRKKSVNFSDIYIFSNQSLTVLKAK